MLSGLVRRPAVLLALALCSVGGVVTLLGRLATGPPVEQKRTPLSNEAGTKAYPAFSPDGQRVAYSARGISKVDPFHVYVRTVATDTPRQLTTGESNDISPAWSPNGEKIAFLRLIGGSAQYIVVPSGGGAEQKLAEFPASGDQTQPLPALSWMRDGKSLVVTATVEGQSPALAIVTLDGKVARITNPAEGAQGDSTPAVSPDGAVIAFVRASSSDGADIYLCDTTGGSIRQLTFNDRPIRGISWTPNGRDLVYSANTGRNRLWRLPAFGGSPKMLPLAGSQAQYPTIAPAGNRLVYSDSPSVSSIWRVTLGSPDAPADNRPLIRSAGPENSPMYSPDGKKIANISDQSGHEEIWMSDADGGNRVQLTRFEGLDVGRPQWAPDSKALVFSAAGEHLADIYTVTAEPGAKPKQITTDGFNPTWSHDGRSIYFHRRDQIWKMSPTGGSPEAVVRNRGANFAVESADGKYLLYRLRRGIWRVPVAGGPEEEFIVPQHDFFWTTLQPTRKGVYYIEFERRGRGMLVSYYDYATKKTSVAFRLAEGYPRGATFSVSPDGKYMLYPKTDQSETQLMLLQNFR